MAAEPRTFALNPDELNALESLGIDFMLIVWAQRGQLSEQIRAISAAQGIDEARPYAIRQALLMESGVITFGLSEANVLGYILTEHGLEYGRHFLSAYEALLRGDGDEASATSDSHHSDT